MLYVLENICIRVTYIDYRNFTAYVVMENSQAENQVRSLKTDNLANLHIFLVFAIFNFVGHSNMTMYVCVRM